MKAKPISGKYEFKTMRTGDTRIIPHDTVDALRQAASLVAAKTYYKTTHGMELDITSSNEGYVVHCVSNPNPVKFVTKKTSTKSAPKTDRRTRDVRSFYRSALLAAIHGRNIIGATSIAAEVTDDYRRTLERYDEEDAAKQDSGA